IRGAIRQSILARQRRDIHDVSAAVVDEHGSEDPSHVEDAAQVGVHDLFPSLEIGLMQWGREAADSGIVDDDPQALTAIAELLAQGFNLRQGSNIAAHRLTAPAALADFPCSLLQALRMTGSNDYLRPKLRQLCGNGRADSSRPAGHDCQLVPQFRAHFQEPPPELAVSLSSIGEVCAGRSRKIDGYEYPATC